jgi:hypothetical protein
MHLANLKSRHLRLRHHDNLLKKDHLQKIFSFPLYNKKDW